MGWVRGRTKGGMEGVSLGGGTVIPYSGMVCSTPSGRWEFGPQLRTENRNDVSIEKIRCSDETVEMMCIYHVKLRSKNQVSQDFYTEYIRFWYYSQTIPAYLASRCPARCHSSRRHAWCPILDSAFH